MSKSEYILVAEPVQAFKDRQGSIGWSGSRLKRHARDVNPVHEDTQILLFGHSRALCALDEEIDD
jgi:hypothetical protein